MMPLPLGFNEAKTYRRSAEVSPEIAHSVKLCVHTELTQTDDLAVFYEVSSLEEYYWKYKDKHAPNVTEDVWAYFDTSAALFDEWIERDDIHVVLYDYSQKEFKMLQNIADIHAVGAVAWADLLRNTLKTQRWKGRRMRMYVVSADLVWL